MKILSKEGKSQSYVAKILNRNPSTIAQAAIRYNIKFHAKPGRPKGDPEQQRQRKILTLRNYRKRRGVKTRIPKVLRFDDLRVMIKE